MKSVAKIVGMALTCPCFSLTASAQGKGLAATMDVFVFPADGQAIDRQSKDEVE